MAKPLSTKITSMSGSATVQVMNKARALKQQGIDIMDLGGGDPDFDTPQHIQNAAIESMKSGFTHYVASSGVPQLRKAIAKKLATDNGVEVDPDKGVIISSGGKLALYCSLSALLNEGDEVILPEPAWVTYRPIIKLAGATTVPLNLTAENGFSLTESALKALVTPKTKAIIVNSPCNPTGKVLSRKEMEIIAKVAVENDLYVVSDEIYEKIIYDGHKHISPASLPGMVERTLTLNGHSKAYAMTGWRLGYVAGPEVLIKEVGKLQQQTATCAPSFVQMGGLAALEGTQEPVTMMTAEYKRRRDFFVDMLNAIPHVSCFKPEGAFYVFPKFDLGKSSIEVADMLLEKARVAGTPGSAFGPAGEGHVRFSIASAPEVLETAANRIREMLS
ncbi:MAG TPA: pyridoxal phosphate-dependent aminotransferase [Chloroflexota bacterium]|nr:pyridoxal phosphate-dependent aminotransferase [Chloroflexota bacterium]